MLRPTPSVWQLLICRSDLQKLQIDFAVPMGHRIHGTLSAQKSSTLQSCTRGNAAIITHNAVFERIKQEYRIIAIVNRMNP